MQCLPNAYQCNIHMNGIEGIMGNEPGKLYYKYTDF